MKTHKLKTWSEYFNAVKSGAKKFEIRKNDRDFQVGDKLQLIEYNLSDDSYTGNSKHVTIRYILQGGAFGLQDGYVILGL